MVSYRGKTVSGRAGRGDRMLQGRVRRADVVVVLARMTVGRHSRPVTILWKGTIARDTLLGNNFARRRAVIIITSPSGRIVQCQHVLLHYFNFILLFFLSVTRDSEVRPRTYIHRRSNRIPEIFSTNFRIEF